MSTVTNVVLLMGILEEDDDVIPGLDHVNSWLPRQNSHWRLHRVDQYGTNDKSMEVYVALGAFNYFCTKEFLECVRTAPWREPQNVQVLIQEQEEDRFTMYPAEKSEAQS